MSATKFPVQNAAKCAFLLNKITYARMADAMGCTPTTVSLKMNGVSDFTASEIRALSERFGLDPILFIFPDRCEIATEGTR